MEEIRSIKIKIGNYERYLILLEENGEHFVTVESLKALNNAANGLKIKLNDAWEL